VSFVIIFGTLSYSIGDSGERTMCEAGRWYIWWPCPLSVTPYSHAASAFHWTETSEWIAWRLHTEPHCHCNNTHMSVLQQFPTSKSRQFLYLWDYYNWTTSSLLTDRTSCKCHNAHWQCRACTHVRRKDGKDKKTPDCCIMHSTIDVQLCIICLTSLLHKLLAY